jgi:hypothetical protein
MSDYKSLFRAFDGLSGASSNAEAIYTILAAAVIADGEVLKVEEEERDALVHRIKTLSEMREKESSTLQSIRRNVDEKLTKGDRVDALVADAAATIAADKDGAAMAWSVFAHAADIVFADSRVVVREQEFLARLAENLKLPVEEAGKILDFLRKKNAY